MQGLNLADKAIHHCIRQLGKLVRKRCNPFLLQQLQHLRIGQPLNGLFCLGLQRCCVRFDFGFQCLFLFGQFFYAAENTAGILCFGGAVPPQLLNFLGNFLRHKGIAFFGKALLIGVLVVLGKFIQQGFIFGGQLGKLIFQRMERAGLILQQRFLQQVKGQNVPNPAVLHFLLLVAFFLGDKMGVYLFGCTEPLCLDHFKVNGNCVPVVVQQLIGLILVNQRNVGKARKNILAEGGFRFGNLDFVHAVQQDRLHMGGQRSKGGAIGVLKGVYIAAVFDSRLDVLDGQRCIGRSVFSKQFTAQRRERRPVRGKLVQLCCGDAAEHRGVYIPMLRSLRGIHITGNI